MLRIKLIRYTKGLTKQLDNKFLPLCRIKKVLTAFEEIISEELKNGNKVKLANFGVFKIKTYRWKGKTFVVPVFKTSPVLKEQVNKKRW